MVALVTFGGLAVSGSVASAQQDANGPGGVHAAQEPIPSQYIVTLRTTPDAAPAAAAAVTARNGGQVISTYSHGLSGYSARMSPGQAEAVSHDPAVARVEQDGYVHATGTQSPAPSWGLDRVDERAPDGVSSYQYDTTASSVTAYVIDTGISATSADFTGRIGPGQNFAGHAAGGGGVVDPADVSDCNGHGTHVAGTIGGTTYGLAKGVTVVPVRVLDCGGSGSWSGVIGGLDWATGQHTTGKAVANMSLGGGFSQSVNDAVKRLTDDGVVVAVAAGNSTADACSSSPSSEPSALTVGATDVADTRASWSNFGSCVDLFAPGVNITSDWIGSATATNTISGTSMASPHVAGVAALYLESGMTAGDLLANTTTGRVVDRGTGSPNKLVYVGNVPCDSISCPSGPPAPTPPPNDAFTNAQTISTLNGSATGTTVNATKETGEPSHAGNAGGHSIWYRFTAAGDGTATIDTFGSSYDTLLGVYTGSAVNALTQVAANDDTAPGTQSKVQFAATAGTTYQVAVDGYNGAIGDVTITWALPTASPQPPPSGNTGWKSANAQAADSGGDKNGYETNPTNAFNPTDGLYAVDTNSGTGASTSCTSTNKDKHRFYGYDLSGVGTAAIKGLEVQVRVKADSATSSPRLCIQLSSNSGATWTTAKTTGTLTTSAMTYTLGSPTDLWGRTWTTADVGANFRVRVIDVSSSSARDFSLDGVTVRASY